MLDSCSVFLCGGFTHRRCLMKCFKEDVRLRFLSIYGNFFLPFSCHFRFGYNGNKVLFFFIYLT
ncbi:hypothetical protein Hanom_Chr02g00171001 [Helianthus anomalus]